MAVSEAMTSLVLPSRWSTTRPRPKPAAQAVHGRERLLRGLGGVGGFGRVEAEVALAAGGDAGLAEVAAHGGGAAAGALEHGVELAHLAHLHALDGRVHVAAVDAAHRPGEVGGGIERDALGGRAVAPGAADLLPVGLDGRRRVGVDDVAHVRLVDAHAEGDGRHHHGRVGLEELLQPVRAQVLVEAGVVGQRQHACGGQLLGQLVDAVARAGIDHAGPVRPLGHQLQHARRGRRRACAPPTGRAPAARSCRRTRGRPRAAARRGCPRGCARRRWP